MEAESSLTEVPGGVRGGSAAACATPSSDHVPVFRQPY